MGIFVIAEIGINHNGDIDIAKELIDLAADVGVDAVKFQKRTIDLGYRKEFLDSPRESPWGTTKCRNCAASGKHYIDECEWRGHAAIRRVVEMTRFDALELIKTHVDKDPAISGEVRKILQRA